MGCTGYDICMIYDTSFTATTGNGSQQNGTALPVLDKHEVAVLEGELSGIPLEIFSNQPTVQLSSDNDASAISCKAVHDEPQLVYTKNSAVVIEKEGWIDAIIHEEWNVNQICAYALFFLARFCRRAID